MIVPGGGANAHIEANCEERTTAPTVMDCLHGIHWRQASKKNHHAPNYHMLIGNGHGYTRWHAWVSGMTIAQLYWGRMAALLLQLLYHIFPMVDWGFVFVADFCWLLRRVTMIACSRSFQPTCPVRGTSKATLSMMLQEEKTDIFQVQSRGHMSSILKRRTCVHPDVVRDELR